MIKSQTVHLDTYKDLPNFIEKQLRGISRKTIKPAVTKMLKDLEPRITDAIVEKINLEISSYKEAERLDEQITFRVTIK